MNGGITLATMQRAKEVLLAAPKPNESRQVFELEVVGNETEETIQSDMGKMVQEMIRKQEMEMLFGIPKVKKP